jgi:MFS family permease
VSTAGGTGTPAPANTARRLVLTMCALLLFDTAFYAAVTPLVPYYVHHLSISPGSVGLLVAGYPIGTFVFAIPGGWVSSRAGARTAVLAGVSVTGVSTVVFGWSHLVVVLVLARVLEGAGGAFSWAGALSWLNTETPVEQRAETIGTAFGAAAAGALAGPMLGGLADVVGIGPAFSAAGAAALVLAVVLLRLAPPRREGRTRTHQVRAAARHRQFRGGLVLITLAGASFGVIDVLAPLRLARLHTSVLEIAGIFLVAAALETVLAPRVGRLADRAGRRRPLQLTLAAGVVLSLLMAVVVPAAALAVVVVLSGPGFGLLFTPATALVADGADRSRLPQGMAAAVLNIVWAAGASLGAFGAGVLKDASGYLLPLGLLSACCVAALVGTSLSPPAAPRGPDP